MPMYEFACKECGTDFERLMKSTKDKPACPKCKSKKVERQLSAFGMKIDNNFSSSRGSACTSCSPAPGTCSSCSSKK